MSSPPSPTETTLSDNGSRGLKYDEDASNDMEMMSKEIQALEKLLEDSAEVISVLRDKYNEQKAENKSLLKHISEVESEKDALVSNNASLESRISTLEHDLGMMQREVKLDKYSNHLLSEEEQLVELNAIVQEHKEVFSDKERNHFLDEYTKYMESTKSGQDFYGDIVSSLKLIAQEACDHLVEIDEEEALLKEQYPEVEFEKTKKPEDEASRKKRHRRKQLRGEDFVFGNPADRFPVMDEDPELAEEDEEEETY